MIDFSILFEDGEALVIDKPAGLPLDRPRAGGPALEDYLDALRFGFQREPFPVHRLDRDTSGCLLLARNPKALKRFSAAFEAREVAKVYLGVVAGEVAGKQGTIDFSLTKISSAENGWRMIAAKKGKPAVTHWKVIDRKPGMTMVEFRPETGRTHQIRIHALAGLGFALLGDPIYGDGSGARRTMLHAAAITIKRTGKDPISAIAPLPIDFDALGFNVPGFEREELEPFAAPENPEPATSAHPEPATLAQPESPTSAHPEPVEGPAPHSPNAGA